MTIPERRMRKHIYPGVGICIYCASDGGNLGLRNEHIVPGGLGGRLELPHASCHKCEKETHAFEGRVLGGIYGYSRVHLGVRREKKSKKNWPPTIPTTVSDDSGTSEIEVPVDLHPDLFRTIKWGPPEIFARIPPSDLGIQNATMDGMGDRDFWQRIARIGEGKRITLNQGASVRVDEFARFLAKIGHSFAVAEYGLNNFTPFLRNAILNKRPMYLSHYIGMSTVGDSMTPDVHELNIREHNMDGRKFMVARVQLFADIGVMNPLTKVISSMPAYDVVVGEITTKQKL